MFCKHPMNTNRGQKISNNLSVSAISADDSCMNESDKRDRGTAGKYWELKYSFKNIYPFSQLHPVILGPIQEKIL